MKKSIGIVLMLVFSLMSTMIVSAGPSPLAGPNYMGFTPNPKDVTVGDSFRFDVYGDIHSAIDTIAVDNMTFLPAGVVNYTNSARGSLFGDPYNTGYEVIFHKPAGAGIQNALGYAKYWTWAFDVPGYGGRVNNLNATAFNITWFAAHVGTATLTITAGGSAGNGTDPGTTKYTGTVRVHPANTGAFTATAYNSHQINLTWTKGTGADRTVIRYDTSYPTTPTDGNSLYNGTSTHTEQSGLTPLQHVYYSAWAYNTTKNLYSLAYQEDDATTLAGAGPNNPPTFGTPSPTNGSINQLTALTWNIPINDPNGNVFNWNIACSNGQSSSATGASNGTKSLSVSGLAFSTLYRVWVNATDPAGSGNWTRRWYQFTTKANSVPNVPDQENPSNGQTNWNPKDGYVQCHVVDPDGGTLLVSFYWGNGTLIGTVTVTSGTLARVSVHLNELTTYLWYATVNDGHGGITKGPVTGNWTFTTKKAPSGGGTLLNDLLISVLYNGAPVDGSIILIYEGIGTQAVNIVATANTTATGTKLFTLPYGTYTIHVAKAGYQEITKTITLIQPTATGNVMAVVFNLQLMQTSDYLFMAGLIILLVIGLYLSYTVVKGTTYLTASLTSLIILLLNVAVIVLGLYYFWLLAVAGAVLLIAEIIWMSVAK